MAGNESGLRGSNTNSLRKTQGIYLVQRVQKGGKKYIEKDHQKWNNPRRKINNNSA